MAGQSGIGDQQQHQVAIARDLEPVSQGPRLLGEALGPRSGGRARPRTESDPDDDVGPAQRVTQIERLRSARRSAPFHSAKPDDPRAPWTNIETSDSFCTVFATVTACQAILPGLLREFRSAHPDVRLNLITGDAAVALARLDEGSVDLALAAVPDRLPESVVSHVDARTPLVLIAAEEQRGRRLAHDAEDRCCPRQHPDRSLCRPEQPSAAAGRRVVGERAGSPTVDVLLGPAGALRLCRPPQALRR